MLVSRFYNYLQSAHQADATLETAALPDYRFLQFSVNYNLFPSRFSEVHFCRFRLHRGTTKEYAARFLHILPDTCNCRIPIAIDNAEHFFIWCRFFAQARRALNSAFAALGVPFSIDNLLTLGSFSGLRLTTVHRQSLANAVSNFLHSAHQLNFLRF